MSPQSLNLLAQLFSEKSTLNLPAGLAEQILEIRAWVNGEVAKLPVAEEKE